MKKTAFLYVLLASLAISVTGCGKVGVKGPAFFPGFGEDRAYAMRDQKPEPLYGIGDIVRCRMLDDMQGIVIQNNYKYLPELKAWYYVVDFYPSSALVRLDFSKFDNYERRYVYEFELRLVQRYSRDQISARWQSFDNLVQ